MSEIEILLAIIAAVIFSLIIASIKLPEHYFFAYLRTVGAIFFILILADIFWPDATFLSIFKIISGDS